MKETSLPVPNRSTYAWAGLAFIAFVVYGSWMPFDFQPVPRDQAVAQFRDVLTGPLRLPSRSDWVANVLLMLPVSFTLLGALGADRPRWGVVGDAVLVLPGCLILSGVVEFGQLFVPNRLCSLNDIAAQGVGAGLGALMWGVCGQKVTEWGRRFWQAGGPASVETRLLPAYLGLLGAVYLLPLDLTLSPAAIYHKFKEGRINLVPFAPPAGNPYSYAEKTILNVIYLTLLGLLLAGLPGRRWRDRREAGRVFLLALCLVGLLNGVKLLVLSRSFDVTDVAVGSLSVVAGWLLGLSLRGAHWGEAGGPPVRVRACLLAAWLALVTFATWQPFDFDVLLASPRLASISFVPFADLWQGDELMALTGVVQKLVLYLPLGLLLTTWRPGPARWAWLPSLLAGLLVALVLEAGQLVLASRTAGVSDVYVEAAGALLGSLVTRRVCGTGTDVQTGRRVEVIRPVGYMNAYN